MHISTSIPLLLPFILVSTLSLSTSLSLTPPDAETNANSTLPASDPSPLHERQGSTTFVPATLACPPVCPPNSGPGYSYTNSAPGDAANLSAIVTGMCVAVGIAGIAGGLGLGMGVYASGSGSGSESESGGEKEEKEKENTKAKGQEKGKNE